MHSMLFNFKENRPLVIPTNWPPRPPEFRTAVLLEGSEGNRPILLVLGTIWDPTTLQDSCWFEIVPLSKDINTKDSKAVIEIIKRTDPSQKSSRRKTVPLDDGPHNLYVSVEPRKMQGLDLFYFDIGVERSPKAVS